MYGPLISLKGHLPWYHEHVSRPSRKHLGRELNVSRQSNFQTAASAWSVVGLSALAHAPHLVSGASPYLLAMHIRSKGSKARAMVNMYNMGIWQKAQYITGLAKAPKGTATLGTILWSGVPRRAQAMRAARYAKFASRAVPILGTAALAYDLYDVIANRSLWGIDFG